MSFLEQKQKTNGPYIIWVTPIRALAKEIKISIDKANEGFGLEWQTAIRSGDTKTTQRKKQLTQPPEVLITTPESLHVLMTVYGYTKFFSGVHSIICDEWHELMGSKRGVQAQLAISRIRGLCPDLRVWGISATIGNLAEGMEVLLGSATAERELIVSNFKKQTEVISIFPDDIEEYSWAGHLGLSLAEKVLPIIYDNKTTLIFTNTRAKCELWYHRLLELDPSLAGDMAMHHGSIARNLRDWVEDALYEGRLSAVVSTSSLDLGVDFRPVETIIQVGSPKSVSRFMQRAGRSGHEPGAVSTIYFLPTNTLELIEAAALREALKGSKVELRVPYIRCWDVLIQYLMTLAVSEGFRPEEIYEEVIKTHCYSSMEKEDWQKILHFLVHGSQSLKAYDEYSKVVVEAGLYKVTDRRIAQRHKLSIGTITSDAMLMIKYLRGKKIGTVEEWFVAHLKVGDSFWFAGRSLELVRIKDMTVLVRNSSKKNKRIPSYLGGRMPLSAEMSEVLRNKLYEYQPESNQKAKKLDKELSALSPLLDLQKELSILPSPSDFLVEYFQSKEGFHLLMYPFEGRYVHEGMGALIGQRLARKMPISFSIGMNDHGFELLSDRKIDVENRIVPELFSPHNISKDIQASINAAELARRKFRDVARISGLIFQGFPGKAKKDRHLQASSSLLFEVFQDYEPENLLYLQTFEEVMTFQLEEARMIKALERVQNQNIIITYPDRPTPLSFPIMVDRLREKMTSERLEDRIAKMKVGF